MPNSIKYKIVFVDDDDFLRKLYVSRLSEAGFAVYDFANATDDFVKKVATIRPDLISLDIINVKRSGFETLILLKKNKRTKDIPVFFLTNMNDPWCIQKSKDLGAAGYLINAQVLPKELVEKYVKYIEEHRK